MREIVEASRSALSSVYSPHSEYEIGAAVLTKSGSIHTGCNIENSELANSIHAEETAVAEAVISGETVFEAVSVSSEVGATPCGMCRQTLHEFSSNGMVVLVDDMGKGEINEYTLSEMYPFPFPE